MSLSLRPVVEMWGEFLNFSIRHEEMVDLLGEISDRAESEHLRSDYNDIEVVWIEKGQAFLDLLRGGREAILQAKAKGKDYLDLTDADLVAVDEMAEMVPRWEDSIDPNDGALRIYVD